MAAADDDTTKRDHRSEPRRRGEELEAAILEAAAALLAEVGYEGLTMDQVARRAHTGKTSLYRRWPTRAELVTDALRDQPVFAAFPPPDSGDIRDDLLVVLRRLATVLEGQHGEVLRGLVGELNDLSEEFRAAREWVLGLRQEYLIDVLRRGAERGQVRPGAVNARIATLGPSLVISQFLMIGGPVRDEELVEIVDEVILPLLRP